MSIQTFVATVEHDIVAGVEWVGDETGLALTAIWNAAKPVFVAFEPTLVHGVLTQAQTFLAAAEADIKAGDLADIEQAFLESLEGEKMELFNDAKTLGSNLLQILLGLAKGV